MRGSEAVPDTAGKYDPTTHISVGAVTMPPHPTGAIVIKIPKTKNRQPGHREQRDAHVHHAVQGQRPPGPLLVDPRSGPAQASACAPSTAPFFVDPHGQPITRAQVEKRLQAAAKGADVTLHSPRIGIVTYMRADGFTTDQIRAWERWTSSAVETYFRGGA
jgi:hypothetical protein